MDALSIRDTCGRRTIRARCRRTCRRTAYFFHTEYYHNFAFPLLVLADTAFAGFAIFGLFVNRSIRC